MLGLVVGNIASSVDQIADNPDVEEMLRKMSGGQGSLLDAFFGTELRFLAVGAAAYGDRHGAAAAVGGELRPAPRWSSPPR